MKSGLLYVAAMAIAVTAGCGPKQNANTPTGRANGTEVQNAIQISSAGSNAAEPAIATDEKGNLFVIWVEHSTDQAATLMLQKFDAMSKPSGAAIRINPEGANVKSWHGDPPTIAVGRDGSIFVGWNRANGARGNDLVLSVSHDGGTTFDEPVKVNDDVAPASHGMHSLALGGDGRIFMAWLDERNVKIPEPAEGHHEAAEPNSEVYFATSTDGGKSFTANKKLATDVCPCCKTTLLAAGDGRVFAAWRQVLPGDFRHIAVATSSDNGATFSQAVIVSDDKWQLNACPVSGAALEMAEDGLMVAWYTAGDAGQPGIYTARSNDGGKSFSSRNLLSNEAASGTPVMKGGEMIFAAVGNKIELRRNVTTTTLPDALYPAAASDYVCFVRKSGDKSSVMLASLR